MSNKKSEAHPVDTYVGSKIRQRRIKLNLSLVELAEKINISHQQIQKYEQGITRVSAGMLYDFAKIFGTSVSYFYDGYSSSNNISIIPEKGQTIDFDKNRPLNILIVEDEPNDEILTRKAIESCAPDAGLYSVHDGVKALEFLRNKKNINSFPRPDIIFLDLNIPKKDGVMVLKDIKRDKEIKDIPVIILTNCINAYQMYEVYLSYASGFIPKSFDYQIFKKGISSAVNYWSDAVVLPYMH